VIALDQREQELGGGQRELRAVGRVQDVGVPRRAQNLRTGVVGATRSRSSATTPTTTSTLPA